LLLKERTLRRKSQPPRLVFDWEEFWVDFTDNFLFVVASLLYLIIAVNDVQWQVEIQGVPEDVLAAEDDKVWTAYGIDDDDYVFKVRVMRHCKIHVSKYMILYLAAAVSFVALGVLEYYQYNKSFTGFFLILAGIFGVLAAITVEDYEHMSDNFDLISSCMFSLEAVQLFVDPAPKTYKCWLRTADTCFFLGATLDVITSIIDKVAPFSLPLSYMGVLDAFLWVVCATIYSSVMVLEFLNGDYHYDPNDDVLDDEDDDDCHYFGADSEQDTEASSVSRYPYGSIDSGSDSDDGMENYP
jgi:hypothetical protein